ncbi:uncharacterized protein SPAPADRAFT_66958 [Spathaspora passalidarum NRRL Y-27907]|uniref:Mitochondrial group I intron splicing factor CCM1 n=1 Tax=Spathaspora passalidarum (strain NRRL Y-27907 / 11-Y1) TaxID=619300 RepID=G3AQ11_SPAPN|nr:uncharacterized protein SPAPADRAFT_66958 [Spathaspora passalidarum NRRL Y-27907]EGW32332.1 hypothetical protein SPAPADRAFT_66958 [Spathaspora passalidarum NRRL Y-27907]
MNKNSVKMTKEYGKFIKELYPRTKKSDPIFRDVTKEFNVVNNSIKYSSIVFHERLFQAYMSLPSPRALFITSDDLNQLVQVFLYASRNFHRLNTETNIKQKPTLAMRKYAKRKLDQRKAYSNMCSKILQDIVEAKLPLTPTERIKMVQLSLFKDRQNIAKYYDQEVQHSHYEPLKYRKFNYETYTQLRKSLPPGTNSNLLLLDLALRNNEMEVVEEIWNSNEYVSGSGVIMLLNYFQTKLNKPDTIDYLIKILHEINSMKSVKAAVIDEVISLLTKMGRINLAQDLVQAAYYSKLDPKKSWVHYSERDYYAWCRSIYHRLMAITKDYEVIAELHPSIKTFLSLAEYHCYTPSSSFSQVRDVLRLMDKTTDIPTSQVFYKLILKGFDIHSKIKDRQDWTIDNLLQITSEIIGEVNTVNSHEAIMDLIKSGDIESLQQLEPNFHVAFKEEETKGEVKTSISADFLDIILDIYVVTLESYYRATEDDRYNDAIMEIKRIKEQHTRKYSIAMHTTHEYSRIIYDETETKKAYLIEAINRVSDIISREDGLED